MNFIISRYFLILTIIFVCSCSSLKVDYSYFGYFQNAFFNNDFEIDSEYYEELEFSYLKIKHKDKEAIYVLSDISDDVYTWTGSNYETLKTYKGIIIEMSGIYNFYAFPYDVKNFEISKNNPFLRYNFEDPELVMHRFNFKLIDTIPGKRCVLKKYRRESKIIGFRFDEKICIKENLPLYTTQKINNLIDEFELEFIYRF